MVRRFAFVSVVAAAIAAPAFAGDVGSAEEAKALLAKAVEHVGKVGSEAAYKDFSAGGGAFTDRDLYVFCQDMQGVMLAHGGNKGLIGKDLNKLKDADGKEFVKEMIQVASTKGEGWVDYKWTNPTSKKIEPKSSFIRKVGNGFCGVGIYKK